jgi:hypothetical protein
VIQQPHNASRFAFRKSRRTPQVNETDMAISVARQPSKRISTSCRRAAAIPGAIRVRLRRSLLALDRPGPQILDGRRHREQGIGPVVDPTRT